MGKNNDLILEGVDEHLVIKFSTPTNIIFDDLEKIESIERKIRQLDVLGIALRELGENQNQALSYICEPIGELISDLSDDILDIINEEDSSPTCEMNEEPKTESCRLDEKQLKVARG